MPLKRIVLQTDTNKDLNNNLMYLQVASAGKTEHRGLETLL